MTQLDDEVLEKGCGIRSTWSRQAPSAQAEHRRSPRCPDLASPGD